MRGGDLKGKWGKGGNRKGKDMKGGKVGREMYKRGGF